MIPNLNGVTAFLIIFPAGTWCHNDVTLMSLRSTDVASMSVQYHSDVICPLGFTTNAYCCISHYRMVGWLFWVKRPFETVFQSISGRLPERGRKRRERIEESKNVQTNLPAPTASAIGPCPTIIQIVGRPGTGSLPRTSTPPYHL